MPAKLIALAVMAVVAAAIFGIFWLIERRSSRAQILKDRLAGERKAPERSGEEQLAVLRDEHLSGIPALDSLLRRSSRISDLQKLLDEADISVRAGNLLGNLSSRRSRRQHPGLCPQRARRSSLHRITTRFRASLFLRVDPGQ